MFWTHTQVDETHVFTGMGGETVSVTPSGDEMIVSTTPPTDDKPYLFSWEHRGKPGTLTMSRADAIGFLNDRYIHDTIRPELLQNRRRRGRIVVDGVVGRMRRGKFVPIPEMWVGNVTFRQTIMKRQSKQGGRRYRGRREH